MAPPTQTNQSATAIDNALGYRKIERRLSIQTLLFILSETFRRPWMRRFCARSPKRQRIGSRGAAEEGEQQRRNEQEHVLPEGRGRGALDEVAEAAAVLVAPNEPVAVHVVVLTGQEEEEGDERDAGPEHPRAPDAEQEREAEHVGNDPQPRST